VGYFSNFRKENYEYIAPALFLFILPFPHTVTLRLFTLGISAIAAALIWRQAPPLPNHLRYAVWAWILCAVFSLIFALDVNYSLGELKNEIGYAMVAFLTFYSLTTSEGQWRLWNHSLTLGVITVSAFTVYYFSKGMVGWDAVLGMHGGPGSSSTYLVFMSPLLLIAIEQSVAKHSANPLPWILLTMVAVGGYLTQVRAFWIALAAAIVIYMGLRLFRRSAQAGTLKSIILIALTALALAATMVTAVMHWRHGVDMSLDASLNVIANDERLKLWKFALTYIYSHPLLGTGFGFGSSHAVLAAQGYNDANLWHAHNLLLSYGLQMGIPGVLVLAVLISALSREFFLLHKSSDQMCSMLGAAGLALLAAMIAKTMTDLHWGRNNSLLFWALTGMILGYGKRLVMQSSMNDKQSIEH
jgi:O-antigen ligase